MTTEDTLRALDARRTAVLSQRARDEVEVENATKSLADAKAQLKAEFNVETGAELKAVRDDLTAQIETETKAIEEQLAAAGA